MFNDTTLSGEHIAGERFFGSTSQCSSTKPGEVGAGHWQFSFFSLFAFPWWQLEYLVLHSSPLIENYFPGPVLQDPSSSTINSPSTCVLNSSYLFSNCVYIKLSTLTYWSFPLEWSRDGKLQLQKLPQHACSKPTDRWRFFLILMFAFHTIVMHSLLATSSLVHRIQLFACTELFEPNKNQRSISWLE